MQWTETILERLRTEFNCKPFIVSEANKVLKNAGYTKSTIKQAIYQLTKERQIIRMGRGVYKFQDFSHSLSSNLTVPDSITVAFTSAALIKAEKVLKKKGTDYMITGPSALTSYHQHLSRKMIHLIYVITGAGEYTCSVLCENKLRAFLNPKGEQISLLLNVLEDSDYFIVREYAKLEGNVDGRATIERAIVDTYFETTRKKIPFSELEVGRVIGNAFKTEKLDLTKLLYYADRHGIRSELQSIVKELEPDMPLTFKNANKSADKVIAGIRSY